MKDEQVIKKDTAIVFLKPHRHDGVDYKKDEPAMVTVTAADKLVKREIAKLSSPSVAAKKEGGAA
jgi:hypothetical protein